MKRMSLFTLVAALCLMLVFGVSVSSAATVKCTWVKDNKPHPVISGEETSIKAVLVDPLPEVTYTYTVDFGDGSAVVTGVVDDPNAIEVPHTYTGKRKTEFTATVTVSESGNASSTVSDTYSVKIKRDKLKTRRNIAIEEGLWYLHKETRHAMADEGNGDAPVAHIGRRGSWRTPLSTLSGGLAMIRHDFLTTGDQDNPYTADMQGYVNYITERLNIIDIRPKGDGETFPQLDPEARKGKMIDGYGVYFAKEEFEYELGEVLHFLSKCGYSDEKPVTYNPVRNYTTPPEGESQVKLTDWTFGEIRQQIVDFLAWAQLYQYANDYRGAGDWNFPIPEKDTTLTVPVRHRGGWPYWTEGWGVGGEFGDNSPTYWVVRGLRHAKKKGAVIPRFVRTELADFLALNQDLDGSGLIWGSTSNPLYEGELRFGDDLGHHLVERAGMGLTMFKFLGLPVDSPEVSTALGYIDRLWTKDNYDHRQDFEISSARDSNACGIEDCFTHFNYDRPIEFGHHECATNPDTGVSECVWVVDLTVDRLNIFGLLTISEGLKAYGIDKGSFPTSDSIGYSARYKDLIIYNQLPDGGWTDKGWGEGDEFGSGWALQILSNI